ncbi:MAG: N-acetyltransferase [Calditrichaeota bacterium]|nr:MAG: N-acetyltransferase [Calditrichota bacterium]
MHPPFLIGEKIYLRAPEDGDEINATIIENHPDPRETLFFAYPTSSKTQSEKLENAAKDRNTILFTICTQDADKPIGQTSFIRIDWVGRMATFYIAIAEKENWSLGFGSETLALMIDYGFATLNLNRIQLHVLCSNTKAFKIYENQGFTIEGTLRQAMYYKNRYHDFYLMALLRQEWDSGKK